MDYRVDQTTRTVATWLSMDSKQARFPATIVDWYERAAEIENERRANARLSSRVTWGDLVRVASCQAGDLPAEHEIDFAWIREEMKKRPVKGPAKRTTKRT